MFRGVCKHTCILVLSMVIIICQGGQVHAARQSDEQGIFLADARMQSRQINLAPLAVLSVSDALEAKYAGIMAVDKRTATSWVARGAKGKWLVLRWKLPVDIDFIDVIARQGHRDSGKIWSSDIIFSDNSVLGVGSLNPGQKKTVRVQKKGITWLKFWVYNGLNNVGLSELAVYGRSQPLWSPPSVRRNLAQEAKISVSSWRDKKNQAHKVNDQRYSTEWIADAGSNQWLSLRWDEPVDIASIRLSGRLRSGADIIRSYLILSDSTTLNVGKLLARKQKTLAVNAQKISWLTLQVVAAAQYAGLAEIEVVAQSKSDPHLLRANLAQLAYVQVSDSRNSRHWGGKATDRRLDTGWVASGSDNKWITLRWNTPVAISQVTLTGGGRGKNAQISASDLIFSDGTSLPVGQIRKGEARIRDMDRRNISWIKFFIREGTADVGLAEIQVR